MKALDWDEWREASKKRAEESSNPSTPGGGRLPAQTAIRFVVVVVVVAVVGVVVAVVVGVVVTVVVYVVVAVVVGLVG